MLNQSEVQLASLAVREIRTAVSNSLLHAFGSPPVRRSIEKAHQCLREILLHRPRITLDFAGVKARVEESSLEEGVVDSTHVLHEILQSHQIAQVTFTQGLSLDQLTAFFALLKPRFLPDEQTALSALRESPLKNIWVNGEEPVEAKPEPKPEPEEEILGELVEDIPQPGESKAVEKPKPPPLPPKGASPKPAPPKLPSSPGDPDQGGVTFPAMGAQPVTPDTVEELRYQEAEGVLDRLLEIMSEIENDRRRESLIQRMGGLMGGISPQDPKLVEKAPINLQKWMKECLDLRNDLMPGSSVQRKLDNLMEALPAAITSDLPVPAPPPPLPPTVEVEAPPPPPPPTLEAAAPTTPFTSVGPVETGTSPRTPLRPLAKIDLAGPDHEEETAAVSGPAPVLPDPPKSEETSVSASGFTGVSPDKSPDQTDKPVSAPVPGSTDVPPGKPSDKPAPLPTAAKFKSGASTAQILNPAREEEAGASLRRALDEHQMENFIPLWVVLWNGIFSGAETIQALGLRHLARLDWRRIPRPLQLEGLQYLENLLKGPWSEAIRLTALDRLEEWLGVEMAQPDWQVLGPVLNAVRSLGKEPGASGILATRAQTLLKGLFPAATLEKPYGHLGTPQEGEAVWLFQAAGPFAKDFLQERLSTQDASALQGAEGDRLARLIGILENGGERPLERFLERDRTGKGLAKLLALSSKIPFPADQVEAVRQRLAQVSLDQRRQALQLLETSGRKDLHVWALELLQDPDLETVRYALKVLVPLRIGGASRSVIAMLETREWPTKEARESFWAEVCRSLGEMEDTLSIKSLMEWAQSYGLMEKRKEKSLSIRRAALAALGNFKSNQVKTFLEGVLNSGDAEVNDVATDSLEKVAAKLASSPEAPE